MYRRHHLPLAVQFPAPFHWCDRACPRCPLSSECELCVDDLPAMMSESDAIPAPSPADSPRRVPSLVLIAMQRRTKAALIELERLADKLDDDDPNLGFVQAAARPMLLLLLKATLMPSLAAQDLVDPEWLFDGAPALLLIERLLDEAASAVAILDEFFPRFVKKSRLACKDMGKLLAPFLEDVPARHRAELDALIERGRAPSPFCTR